jgi:hypothetical protein
MKRRNKITTLFRWLVFIVAGPFIAIWVFRSFVGLAKVLLGYGDVEAWMGVFSCLLILAVTVAVLEYHSLIAVFGGDE